MNVTNINVIRDMHFTKMLKFYKNYLKSYQKFRIPQPFAHTNKIP